ncbi:hypothetical protein INT43_003520 [Umbelopsis isabellina]|uniref:Peptidase S1 domain-containing protein n=1 Tax=Mortierella isabellina TaxID=91625 RepID=A0A8H7UE57_MORIS|nr:hypothetical protein INT43_003520 [Umbelopsis isabellina]
MLSYSKEKLLFLLLASYLTATHSQIEVSDRIGYGSNAVEENLSNIVRITVGQGSCSGTIIGTRTVLTAAHCIDENSKQYVQHSTRDGPYWSTAKADKIPASCGIKRGVVGGVDSDLGLLYTDIDLYKDSAYSKPFLRSPRSLGANYNFKTLGYGIDQNQRLPAYLQEANQTTTLVDQYNTRTTFPTTNSPKVCPGDSGSANWVFDGGEWKIISITSSGDGRDCAKARFSNHKLLAPHISWIGQNIDKSPCEFFNTKDVKITCGLPYANSPSLE